MFEHGVLTTLLFQNKDVNVIRKFPGTLPVSLSRKVLEEILPFGYVFSIKADGDRAFLFILQDLVTNKQHVYLYGRDESIVLVSSNLTKIETIEELQKMMSLDTMRLTVLDVEVLHGSEQLLVFDALCLSSMNVVNISYERRHARMCEWVERMSKGRICETETSDKWLPFPSLTLSKTLPKITYGMFTLFPKPIFSTCDFGKVWRAYEKSLGDLEGAVFYRLLTLYSPFRCDEMAVLKWKVLNRVTVDFLVDARAPKAGSTVTLSTVFGISAKFTTETKGNVILLSTPPGSQYPLKVAYGFVPPHLLVDVDTQIAEFYFIDGAWQFQRVRRDKSTPNDISVAVATMKNIEENLTSEMISDVLI
jgi:hypothetical protein